MRVARNKVNELTIARFIKGLYPNKVELRPYLFFNDVNHLTIKIKKELKGKKPFPNSLISSTIKHP